MGQASLALGVLALAPLLAGCLSSPGVEPAGLVDDLLGGAGPPAPRLRCPPEAGGACNLLATLEPERQGNEVTIAVNPRDPRNVVAGAKDYFPSHAGQCVWGGVYHTKDGATFASDNVPGSPWLLLTSPGEFEPTPVSQYWCATDPVVAFGPDGTLYYTLLAYQGDPVTASKVGKEATCALNQATGAVPCSGPNDILFNRVSIVAARSNDGGASFGEFSLIDSGTFPLNFHDRQWVEVDQRSGAVYVAWTSVFLPGNSVYRSTDGGRSWSGPVLLNNPPTALHGPRGMFVAVGPGGEVVVSGCGDEGPMVAVSADGAQTFTPWQVFARGQDEGMESEYRSGQVCMVAVDDTDGPYAGSVYVVWSDTRNGNRDIYFKAKHLRALPEHGFGAMSHDEGIGPLRLNDDEGSADQFFPAIAVSPRGVVDVVWYDRRNDPENRLLDIYHTYSLDGGRTWSRNFRVTEVSSDPAHSKHQGGFTFIGDYIDLDSSEECAWPAWVDTRAEKADVMTACVERPGEPRA